MHRRVDRGWCILLRSQAKPAIHQTLHIGIVTVPRSGQEFLSQLRVRARLCLFDRRVHNDDNWLVRALLVALLSNLRAFHLRKQPESLSGACWHVNAWALWRPSNACPSQYNPVQNAAIMLPVTIFLPQAVGGFWRSALDPPAGEEGCTVRGRHSFCLDRFTCMTQTDFSSLRKPRGALFVRCKHTDRQRLTGDEAMPSRWTPRTIACGKIKVKIRAACKLCHEVCGLARSR